MSKEAMKLALEALQFALHVGFDESSESQIKKGDKAVQQHQKAITALREALAELPALRVVDCHATGVCVQSGLRAEQPVQQCKWPTCQSGEYQQALAEQIKRELVGEQPAQQEPVAWHWSESNGQRWFDWTTDWSHHDKAKSMGFPIEYAYTSPPAQRTFVGLTDEEVTDIWAESSPYYHEDDFARAIEAKLRSKNEDRI